MTHHESAHEDTEDRFYAQFDSRDVELMTLDELQAAFEAGQIHENTFVCREGSTEWLTLAEVAGLGEEEEEAPLVAPALETRPPMPARRPDASESAAPIHAETRPPMPGSAETRPPMPARRPEGAVGLETRPALPERRPEMNTVPAARFQTAATAQSIPPAASITASPISFAPVTSNIDLASLDVDELALRPKRRWGLVLAAAAALAVAGGGTVFALGGGESAPVAVAANKPLEATASQRPVAPTMAEIEKPSEPAAAPAAPEAAAPEAAKSAPQFSDDMKQALLAADKGRVTKKAQKLKARAAAPAPRRAKSAGPSSGFKSSGSAYDPLNGKL